MSTAMKPSWLVCAAAVALDILFGDPPNRFHPVAWMGTAIAWLKRHAPARDEAARFRYGGGIVLGGGALAWIAGKLLEKICAGLPAPLAILAEAAVLKMTIGVRGLARAGSQVSAALEDDDLPEARRLLSWHLVSRDTSALDRSQVAAAAVESIAENFSDGAVGPMLFYLAGGLPAACAYRYSNTCDSMLGYHDAEHEWLGKIPARLDDGLNYLPARLSVFLLLLGARLVRLPWRQAVLVWRRDSGSTASPNAGHPMSAMAGVLGVELEKVGHYRLGQGSPQPGAGDIRRAISVMYAALAAGVGLAAAIGWIVRQRRQRGRRRTG